MTPRMPLFPLLAVTALVSMCVDDRTELARDARVERSSLRVRPGSGVPSRMPVDDVERFDAAQRKRARKAARRLELARGRA